MSKDLSDNLLELNEAVKGYIQTKLDLAKITVLEKTTRLSLYLISSLIVVLFLFLILACITTVFVVWYHDTYQNLLIGLLIAIGALVMLALSFITFGKRFITKNVLSNISEILFEEDEEETE